MPTTLDVKRSNLKNGIEPSRAYRGLFSAARYTLSTLIIKIDKRESGIYRTLKEEERERKENS